MYRSIVDAVLSHAREFPDKLAIADTEEIYSYLRLTQAVSRVSAAFHFWGIKAKDCVLIECTQNAAYLIFGLACGLSGAVFVPIEKRMSEQRVSAIYGECKARCIIGETDYSHIGSYHHIKALWEQADALPYMECKFEEKSSVAEILFTTGTTGQPKGIVISNKANIAIAENIQQGVGMGPGTVEIIPLPLSHSHGLRTCYANLFNGSSIVLTDGIANMGLFFKMMKKFDVNAIDLSPTLAKLLIKVAKKELQKYAASIGYIEIGTAMLDDVVKEQLKSIFAGSRLYNFYGSTEAGRSCVLNINKFDAPDCIGYPSKNASFCIVDEERNVINSSKEVPGLIAVRGKMMMDSYLNSDGMTREALVDGTLYTNDLGYMDSLGRLYVIGRKGDVINYKGIKIAPEEIENIAGKYPGIVDCACIPAEDDICGQVPKLFIEVENKETYDNKDFWAYLRNNLEATRVPAAIEVVGHIPRSLNGKLQRGKLRE